MKKLLLTPWVLRYCLLISCEVFVPLFFEIKNPPTDSLRTTCQSPIRAQGTVYCWTPAAQSNRGPEGVITLGRYSCRFYAYGINPDCVGSSHTSPFKKKNRGKLPWINQNPILISNLCLSPINFAISSCPG